MPPRLIGTTSPTRNEPVPPRGPSGSSYVRNVVKRATELVAPCRTSEAVTGYTSGQVPLSGVQPSTRVGAPAGHIPSPPAGAVALSSGSTVTHAVALRPPGIALTATSSWSSAPVDGDPFSACCSSEVLSRRP